MKGKHLLMVLVVTSLPIGLALTLLTHCHVLMWGFGGYTLRGYPLGWSYEVSVARAQGIIWTGLIADTLFWSAVSWVVLYLAYRGLKKLGAPR